MSETVNRHQLLGDVARFCAEARRRDKAARAVAESLGFSDDALLERFDVGYVGGSLSRAIPSKGAVRQVLREIGFLDEAGRETAKGRLIVPVSDEHENIAGFVALGKDGETRFPASLPLYGLNRRAITAEQVVFCGDAMSTLLAAQAGLAALPVSADLSEDERRFIERYRPKKAYLACELPGLVRLLQKLEVPCYQVDLKLPLGPEGAAASLVSARPVAAALGPEATARVLENLVRFDCSGRVYEVVELAPGETDRLRVRVVARMGENFHVDTIDLYAARSRASLSRAAAGLFGAPDAAVESDLRLVVKKLESIRATRKTAASAGRAYVMTADEEADALEYAKRPDLLERVVKDLDALGYVGETLSKKLGFLITISRKLQSPLCGVVMSRAGAGKSRLMEVLSELVPPEDLVSFTRITPQALYYAEDRSLKHKLVVSGEDAGLTGSDYALRELISAKRIKLAAPVKDAQAGRMKTVEYEVEGPIALFYSTTQAAINSENATRCFMLTLDESADQTSEIHRVQRDARTVAGLTKASEGRELKRLHRNVQRLLKNLLVINPYAPDLSFPSQPLEMRREHEKYLSLIDALALLYQHQRPRGRCMVDGREVEYVEASLDDIEQANTLMSAILGEKGEELSGPSRELLVLIKKMAETKARELGVEPRAVRFNRRDIREFSGWSDSQIKAHIGRLEDLEYLLVGKGERGRMYRYELAEGKNDAFPKRLAGLTDIDKLKSKVRKSGMVGDGGAGLVKDGFTDIFSGNGSYGLKVC